MTASEKTRPRYCGFSVSSNRTDREGGVEGEVDPGLVHRRADERRKLLEYCRENGIVVEAYSPLARGRGLTHPTITGIAERLGRTPAQVMLRWAVQRDAVVIPKSSRKDRIRSNAQIFDFELGATEMEDLDDLDETTGTARAR